MEKLTLKELEELLLQIDGKKPQFVTLITKTEPSLQKMTKGGRALPWIILSKVTRVKGRFNVNYQNSVNSALSKEWLEPDFVAGKRPFGYKLDKFNGALVYGANEPKLQMIIDSTEEIYVEKRGKFLYREDLLPWIRVDNRKVTLRTYNLSSIKKISIDKKVYEIVH